MIEPETEDRFWFENLLNHLATKHPQKWKDEDVLAAEQKLRAESSHLKELRTFIIEKSQTIASPETNMFLLKIKQEGEAAIERIFALEHEKEEEARKLAEDIEELIDDLPDKDKLATLTFALNLLLKSDKKSKTSKKKRKIKETPQKKNIINLFEGKKD